MSIKSFLHRLIDGAYYVGIVESDLDTIVKSGKLPDIHWIVPESNDTWLADPFIIHADSDTVTLLVEEMIVPEDKGRLSRIIVDRRSWRITDKQPILELPTHLSFPYPIYENDTVYICPESGAGNETDIYQYDGQKCYDPVKILDGNLADTQIVEIPGKGYFAFTTRVSGEMYYYTSTVEIFHSNSLFGPYTKIQTINKEKPEGRGAGPIFKLSDGTLVRPTQNCGGGYGKGLIFNALKYNNGRFAEEELSRIGRSVFREKLFRIHTFSPGFGLIAVDGFQHYHWLSKFLIPIFDNKLVKDIIIKFNS